jgi:hypothetical protein
MRSRVRWTDGSTVRRMMEMMSGWMQDAGRQEEQQL